MGIRQTVTVESVRIYVNNALSATPDSMTSERLAMAAVLERVLFDTGNYQGFRYLASEYLPAEEQTLENVLRPGYDETRRCYR